MSAGLADNSLAPTTVPLTAGLGAAGRSGHSPAPSRPQGRHAGSIGKSGENGRRGPFSRYPSLPGGLGDRDTPGSRGSGDGEILRLVVACDHRGYDAKLRLMPKLESFSCEVIDIGCKDGNRACDYPDFAAPAAQMVADGEADAAILLDGSGIGMGIVANKVAGIRAATCHDEFTARIAREHNHCNVLCVGTDLVGEKALSRVVEIFLTTSFSAGRHVRRVAKIAELEARFGAAYAAAQSLRVSS